MTTFTAFTTLAGREEAEALGLALEAIDPEPAGVGVFEIEDGSGRHEIMGYFDERPDDIALSLLSAAHGAPEFLVAELPETDWVSHVRRELSPIEAGRFFLYGAHDADKVPADRVALLVEASMAFGTGHHGTTQGCLRALDRLLAEGQTFATVADIGCGTAVLAMAAARTGTGVFLASDIDPVAVEVARANCAANGLADRVECLQAVGLDHPRLMQAAPYDLIFANILKGPLLALAGGITQALRPGGQAILSGILNEQAEEVVNSYAAQGCTVSHQETIGDWTTLTLRRSR